MVTPYICVPDSRQAVRWYADVLGARPVGELVVMPDGRVGHGELAFEEGRVFLSDAHPELGVVAPVPGAGSAVTLHVRVPDAVVARAEEAGAVVDRRPEDTPHGRIAVLRDPFGHRWMLEAG